jgi:hypothetical protein
LNTPGHPKPTNYILDYINIYKEQLCIKVWGDEFKMENTKQYRKLNLNQKVAYQGSRIAIYKILYNCNLTDPQKALLVKAIKKSLNGWLEKHNREQRFRSDQERFTASLKEPDIRENTITSEAPEEIVEWDIDEDAIAVVN